MNQKNAPLREKSLTTQFNNPHIIYLILSSLMIIVGIYLTKHFFNIHFPTEIGSSDALCSGDGFWGCNKATESALGHLFFVPTSFFGVIIGLVGIVGAIFSSDSMERTQKFLIYANALGCLLLLVYSLIVLGGLCKFCTLYYILSFAAAFIFYKFSHVKAVPDVKALGVFALMTVIPAVLFRSHYIDERAKQENLSSQYVTQYENLQDKGEPSHLSQFHLNTATQDWNQAPVRIAVFSDFQCPFCEKVAKQIPEAIRGLEDKVNVAYYFYPLDNACNTKMTRAFHDSACDAAYLAACEPKSFLATHDLIFERQSQLSRENLRQWEKELGLSDCFGNQKLQDIVAQHLNVGEQYNLTSTPTIVINGKAIKGSIPTIHLKAIINSLLD